jgi:hypothetical protein
MKHFMYQAFLLNLVTATTVYVVDTAIRNNTLEHGTLVARLVERQAPHANIVSLPVLDDTGKGTITNVVRAFEWLHAQQPFPTVTIIKQVFFHLLTV